MLGDTFPRDPVWLCPPLSPAFFNSFVKSEDPPYFLPLFPCAYEIGWEGTVHVLTQSWHSRRPGRAPHPRPRPGFLSPVSCSLILEFCLRQRVLGQGSLGQKRLGAVWLRSLLFHMLQVGLCLVPTFISSVTFLNKKPKYQLKALFLLCEILKGKVVLSVYTSSCIIRLVN